MDREDREARIRVGVAALGERVPTLVPEGVRATVAAAIIDALDECGEPWDLDPAVRCTLPPGHTTLHRFHPPEHDGRAVAG